MTSLPPIPAHLPAWQAGHLAWLASKGLPTRYAAPDGTEPARADLSGAVLNRADLCDANLTGAYLRGADLYCAKLGGANLTEANLTEANLYRVDLTGAIGIAPFGPIGRSRRTIYAVSHDDGPRIQAGCWWGTVGDTIARIEADYSDDPAARDRYVAAVRAVAALVSP